MLAHSLFPKKVKIKFVNPENPVKINIGECIILEKQNVANSEIPVKLDINETYKIVLYASKTENYNNNKFFHLILGEGRYASGYEGFFFFRGSRIYNNDLDCFRITDDGDLPLVFSAYLIIKNDYVDLIGTAGYENDVVDFKLTSKHGVSPLNPLTVLIPGPANLVVSVERIV